MRAAPAGGERLPAGGERLPASAGPHQDDAVDGLGRLEAATAELEPPFAIVDLDALDANAAEMEARAGGKPIRLASKSVRCRPLQARVSQRPGFVGTLAYTLPEALWLTACGVEDVLVAYPSVDRRALAELAALAAERPQPPVAMVDCVEHLHLIEECGARRDAPVRVCIDVDAGWAPLRGRVRIGAKRSPVHTAEQAQALAHEILARPALRLVGLMAYEAQIAGLGDAPHGRPVRGLAIRALQAASRAELARRRAEIVAAVRALAPLELVNGGGTGSLQSTSAEAAVTELGAGSGLYGPTLFDAYRAFKPRPATMFALPIVRRPSRSVATALGGGYLASGPADASRLPSPYLPARLRLDRNEGAGEVQTPLLGGPVRSLALGSRVWFRHAKAGELCERFDRLYAISGDSVVEELPTYRGEGRCFL
ncbi:MAG: amino acid deaminase/aldolase [Solirubrobacteraceae bacterium]